MIKVLIGAAIIVFFVGSCNPYPDGPRWIEQGSIVELGQCTDRYCAATGKFGNNSVSLVRHRTPFVKGETVYRRCFTDVDNISKCYNTPISSNQYRSWPNK